MKKRITALLALGFLIGTKSGFALPYSAIRITCPESANISAAAQGDWSGDTSFVTLSLTDVSLGNRLYCIYEGCVTGMLFNLSQNVPDNYRKTGVRSQFSLI